MRAAGIAPVNSADLHTWYANITFSTAPPHLPPHTHTPAARFQDLNVLRGLLKKRESVLTKLERAELQRRASKEGREPKVWTGACCCLGQRVDAVTYLTEELSYYNTEVRQAGYGTRCDEDRGGGITAVLCGGGEGGGGSFRGVVVGGGMRVFA